MQILIHLGSMTLKSMFGLFVSWPFIIQYKLLAKIQIHLFMYSYGLHKIWLSIRQTFFS